MKKNHLITLAIVLAICGALLAIWLKPLGRRIGNQPTENEYQVLADNRAVPEVFRQLETSDYLEGSIMPFTTMREFTEISEYSTLKLFVLDYVLYHEDDISISFYANGPDNIGWYMHKEKVAVARARKYYNFEKCTIEPGGKIMCRFVFDMSEYRGDIFLARVCNPILGAAIGGLLALVIYMFALLTEIITRAYIGQPATS